MRVEILGQERRRRWREEDKLAIVMSVGVAGATITEVAHRHDLTRQQIYAWRSELKKKGLLSASANALFIPVDMNAVQTDVPELRESCCGMIELRPDTSLREFGGARHPDAGYPSGGSSMIGPGTGVRVYLACGITDMRKGVEGLAALAQDVLRQKPTGGAVFAFRGKRGDRLKLLYFDGQGFCLYYKILQKGRFPWPSASDGTARLTSAQLAMLWEGIDWRRPDWGAPPARVG
ncbi:IS66 family insertion sequence element accessory protein TnpB [Rhizobium ruizarguesonis]|uniref:IS66 family insertion sequence element accessory protein TnpB n=1 Tax=Rhizobium ruizarguesonis TaxID=2081791 RepID=UPI003719177D